MLKLLSYAVKYYTEGTKNFCGFLDSTRVKPGIHFQDVIKSKILKILVLISSTVRESKYLLQAHQLNTLYFLINIAIKQLEYEMQKDNLISFFDWFDRFSFSSK